MSRRRKTQFPKWKKASSFLVITYAILVWGLPGLMLPFVNILPYVHTRDFLERLPISIAGTMLIVIAAVANRGKEMLARADSPEFHDRLIHWVKLLAGVVTFTCCGAWLSPNLFGLVSKVLPHQTNVIQVTIESIEYSGSKYKSASLQYRDPNTKESCHVVLSKRLFDYPDMKRGDVLELVEQKTAIGSYI